MLTRRCVACGEPVAPMHVVDGRCVACGCSFEHRPPRTYAEMEGFEPVAAWTRLPFTEVADTLVVPDRGRLRRRWLVFALAVLAAVIASASLLSAVAP